MDKNGNGSPVEPSSPIEPKKNWRQKRIERAIEDIAADWTDAEREQLLDKIKFHGILSEAEEYVKTKTITFADAREQVIERRQFFNKPQGYGTGIQEIDDMTYGLREGELIVLAGPSSHGKTSIALNMATKFVESTGNKILFISLEMTDLEIFDRVDHIADDPDSIGSNFVVQQDRNINPKNIDTIIAANPEAEIIFIDHLHMIARKSQAKSSYEAVNECMMAIKLMALRHNKPIVLLSHVRKMRSGDNDRATAADLKDSSAIEQDADFVIMINADKDDRKIKYLMLEKSRTKSTVPEGTEFTVWTDGLKVIPRPKPRGDHVE